MTFFLSIDIQNQRTLFLFGLLDLSSPYLTEEPVRMTPARFLFEFLLPFAGVFRSLHSRGHLIHGSGWVAVGSDCSI